MSWAETVAAWLSAGAEYRLRVDRALEGRSCAYCGDPAQTLDHIIPRSKGGPDHPDNLVPACQRCNGAKSALSLEEWAGRLEEDLRRAERRRVQLRGIRSVAASVEAGAVILVGSTCLHDWQEVVGEPDTYRCTHCHARWVTAA